jgi:hypothetical protein
LPSFVNDFSIPTRPLVGFIFGGNLTKDNLTPHLEDLKYIAPNFYIQFYNKSSKLLGLDLSYKSRHILVWFNGEK